ncbi:hypothetical protein B0H15DRAFT_910362 [Mycena belliarum]|uniref:CxC5 like cysteine cluster associated with KDZ domain-containing protein n=1 Tax=Mycena belliarum TaxID=1033014 RepID=A0AAD6XPK0_9AGAR|nr:hypothetical protein B0H15DRAFT_910362 [Mycena belliae]
MSLRDVSAALHRFPTLEPLNFHGLTQFLRMGCLARQTIAFQQVNNRRPPPVLPPAVLSTLATSLGVANTSLVQTCWAAFKELIWDHPEVSPRDDEIVVYNEAALANGTSFRHIFPPVRVCSDRSCSNHRDTDEIMTLTDPLSHKATLFTVKSGALPVYTSSLYCRKCNRRYYHNYSVHKQSSLRTYYGGVPSVIQVAQHFFIESALLELFANGMVFGWLSASNWARIYNCALAEPGSYIANNKLAFASVYQDHKTTRPEAWTLELRDRDVSNGFFLYSLLLEKSERSGILVLPHDEANQKDRLQPALAQRNKAMEGIGQEHWAHACDLCFIVFEDDDGNLMKIQSAHCDGDTIGHRCCKAHDCKTPLASNRRHFCPDHEHLTLKCAVIECSEDVETGHRTCSDPEHRALEKAYFGRGKALYQLRSRMKKVGVAVPSDSVPPGISDEDFDDEVIIESGRDGPVVVDCDGKPETGNRRLRAYFGARRTHNEQLIMRACGVILSRATFYGSEAVSAVNDFARATFPTPESTPEFFVFDNNCKLDAHQRAINDQHFSRTGKPVDVFHFNCKHKLSDQHCQLYCNPAAFPELIKNDGKWRFNTSTDGQIDAGG